MRSTAKNATLERGTAFGRRYKAELARLGETYRRALEHNLSDFEHLISRISAGSATFVGSGGALAVARLGADLHQFTTGRFARVATPLELLGLPPMPGTTVVLFSAGARHPDAALAVDVALGAGSPVSLVTSQQPHRIPVAFSQAGVEVITLPSFKDGFLATNTVLSMAAALCRAYGFTLPAALPWLSKSVAESIRSACLVLFGPQQASVALDLEARLAETGLSWVQCADLRNFAHGRHVGLVRRLDQISVVVLVAPADRRLAQRTIGLLPDDASVVTLETKLDYPAGVLDLLIASMKVVDTAADTTDLDPGRPGVSSFGRKLYHLSARRLFALPRPNPIDRKLAAAGFGRRQRQAVADGLADWCRDAGAARIRSLLLDYDGTCCFTHERFAPPPRSVIEPLLRLLEAGCTLAFASGRGRSLVASAREWIPSVYWPAVFLGLYNGSLQIRLTDRLADSYQGTRGILARAAERLKGLHELIADLQIDLRRNQVSVSSQVFAGTQLLPAVQTLLAQAPRLDCKAVASGHSVDLMLPRTTKSALVRLLASEAGAEVMAIGDQGQVGGNDFEMLAATRWSLTVDACSPDVTRCWNLDAEGSCGPVLLARYLGALRPHGDGDGFGFAWAS